MQIKIDKTASNDHKEEETKDKCHAYLRKAGYNQ